MKRKQTSFGNRRYSELSTGAEAVEYRWQRFGEYFRPRSIEAHDWSFVVRPRTKKLMFSRRVLPVGAVLLFMGVLQMVPAAIAQPFRPINELSTWYTDRNPVDVEIVGTKGVGNEARFVDPPVVLRLRLERAYVSLLLRRDQPPSSALSMSFDLPTGLPSALFRAPPEQVETRGDPIHQLTSSESASRGVNISLASSDLADGLSRTSLELKKCAGKKLQDDLFAFRENEPSCHIWSLGFGSKYVAQYSHDVFLLVRCSRLPLGCEMFMPFEGFLPSISFNERHLVTWRKVVEKVTAFLQSKKYH